MIMPNDIKPTDITTILNSEKLLKDTVNAITLQAVEALIAPLPIVSVTDYRFNEKNRVEGWQEGKLHWYPVGGRTGNQSNIKNAGTPENPIGERTVNAFEALIELERQKELLANPTAPAPTSPRDAVHRYFDLPPLDEVPKQTELIRGMKPARYVGFLAERITVSMKQQAKGKDYTVVIEDDGIGQRADRMHETLLSLGDSDKPDKPYLIGMFGQGGSSAFAASHYSWFLSRRAPDLPDHKGGGVGWTIVRQIMPPGRRGFVYWAYLAAHPDGRVPRLPEAAADAIGFGRGTKIGHVGYKFATSNQAYYLYKSLNHLLFNPVLPYYVVTKKGGRRDRMPGNAYKLSDLPSERKDEDKKINGIIV
jgi:hypothetical protein